MVQRPEKEVAAMREGNERRIGFMKEGNDEEDWANSLWRSRAHCSN